MQDMQEIDIIKERLFSGIIKQQDGVERRRKEFVKEYKSPSIFKDEYYILAVLVKEFPNLKISELFVQTFLNTNKASLEMSQYVDVGKYSIGGADGFEEFKRSVSEVYAHLQKCVVDDADFQESLASYKMHYVSEESLRVLETGAVMLSEGVKIRGKVHSGYDSMQSHVKTELLKINEVINKNERRGLVTYGKDILMDEEIENAGLKLITPFGIPALDAHTKGGIHAGDMVSLLAPPKGGKSRLATYIMHTAAINGTNILMWSIENGMKGWEALIRARHCEYFYNDVIGNINNRVVIDDDMIRKQHMSPELKEKEMTSWTDLKSNSRYGTVSSIDEDFDIDTFIEVLDQYVDETGAELICIDYLQLVQGNGRASKHEKVGEAYQKTLQFLKKKGIAGVFPGQLKQVALNMLNKTTEEDMDSVELRDMAGESSEVVRTPDINLAIFATESEKAQGIVKLLGMPSRNHARPAIITMNCNLGTCSFYGRKN